MVNDSFFLPDEKGMLFKGDDDWWSDACIRVDFAGYSEGYKMAADLLVEYIRKTNSDQDFLVFPICFLYRHYLELEFKHFIRNCKTLLNDKENYLEDHDLEKIWGDLKSLINKLTENLGEGIWGKDIKKELDVIEYCVNEFCRVDKKSIAFRYPYPKKQKEGKPQLHNEKHLRGTTHINIKNIYDQIQNIYNFFLGASTLVIEYIETMDFDK